MMMKETEKKQKSEKNILWWIQTLNNLRTGYRPEDPTPVGIQYKCGQIYVYKQRIPVDTQTPTHQKLIGRSMAAPPHVLSPSSILPPPLSHCAIIPARKNSLRV